MKLAEIDLAEAHPSPTNPRKFYDQAKLEELAASVRSKGIIQPLVGRDRRAGGIEIIIGERRRRAAKLAGLKKIPVLVGEIDDLTALELQIVENSQRADVHPLEEADGYAVLQERGRSVEQIAAKVGKSQSLIYQRLRLVTLCPAARQAFLEGKFDAAVAGVVASIANPELQVKATNELLEMCEYDPLRLEDAKDLVRRHYMLVLADAPFPRDDAKLLEGVVACSSCPKRTGAQKELFSGEEAKTDLCLDSDCYQQKAQAQWKRIAAKAEEGGGRVLSDADSKKLFAYGNSHISSGSGYVRLGEVCYDDPKSRTYKALLGARAKEEIILARDPQGGIHELVKKDAAIALLKASNKAVGAALEKEARADERQLSKQRDDRKEAERRRAVTQAVIGRIVEKAAARETKLHDEAWRFLTDAVLRVARHDCQAYVAKRRELEGKVERHTKSGALQKHARDLPVNKLPALILELLISQHAYFSWSDSLDSGLAAAAKVFGVDVKAVRKEVIAGEKKPKAKKGKRS